MMFLETFDYWHWWVFALLLLVLEVLSPAAFFLWMGISAALVGLLMLILPSTGWEIQLILFSVLSVVSIVLWRKRLQKEPTPTDRPNLNRRGQQYVDRTFTLEEPVIDGLGKIKVDDSTWKISGEDCDAGTRIQITGVNGVVLEFKEI